MFKNDRNFNDILIKGLCKVNQEKEIVDFFISKANPTSLDKPDTISLQLTRIGNDFKKGVYHFHFPPDLLDPKYFGSNSPVLKAGLSFSLDFSFSVRSIEKDSEIREYIHYTLENALIETFPDAYGHFKEMLFANPIKVRPVMRWRNGKSP